ncbi:GNAT family N-acetyltransferase [Leptolyngbya sp. NK1-12]|uniref:GNAT family N-acetyltransferase n=2 Tax=Leptolyngbya sp. NK1-12 TaxID=2547451 RepID=A0AA96WBT8_9CYAN|nr:GNAT family N-acetyltransferase [Elainella sp. C42_A2020_010]WNZ22198.1 GNAT family N-acetyltransferase [Leptolyngbya sp. NK1-12]
MKWLPNSDNPSGIRVLVDEEIPRFVDNFDDVATWFGTFDQEKLVACWRFCRPLNASFELELYHPIPTFLKTTKSLEVNRLVIHPDYRNKSSVLFNLVRQTYQQLHQTFDYTFAAVAFPEPGNLYLKIGLQRANTQPFKYSPDDSQMVSLIYLDFKDKTTLASGAARRTPIVNLDKADRSGFA